MHEELENIIYTISVILALLFGFIGFYLQTIYDYEYGSLKKKTPSNNCVKCSRDIDFAWHQYKVVADKIDLPKALIVGCYLISGVFLLNCIFNISDIFLAIPIINKIYMYVLYGYIFLTVVHLMIAFDTINKCIETKCCKKNKDGTLKCPTDVPKIIDNENDVMDYFTFKLSPDMIKNTNLSMFILIIVSAIILGIMIIPTYLNKSKRKK